MGGREARGGSRWGLEGGDPQEILAIPDSAPRWSLMASRISAPECGDFQECHRCDFSRGAGQGWDPALG